MALSPLDGTTAATGSGSTPDVSVSATILINNNEIPINSESISNLQSNGIKFSLDHPTELGTLQNLFDFINGAFSTDLQVSDVESAIDSWPDALSGLGTALKGILTSQLTVNFLNIDTSTGLFQIGITIEPPSPVSIIGQAIKLNTIGFGVSTTGSTGS